MSLRDSWGFIILFTACASRLAVFIRLGIAGLGRLFLNGVVKQRITRGFSGFIGAHVLSVFLRDFLDSILKRVCVRCLSLLLVVFLDFLDGLGEFTFFDGCKRALMNIV